MIEQDRVDTAGAALSGRALLMMLSSAVAHACQLLVATVLAHALTRPDFGTFNQLWLVHKSLIYLFALGLPVSVYYFLPRLPDRRKKGFVAQTMLWLAGLALPLALAMYSLSEPVARRFQNPDLAHYLRLFAAYSLLILPTSAADAILIALGRTALAAVFQVATKVGMIVAVSVAAALGASLDVVVEAIILSGVAEALLGMWLVWRSVRHLPWESSFAQWRSQIRYATPYGLSALVGMLNSQVDKVLIALTYRPAVFALYAAGAFEIPLAGVTSLPMMSVALGELAKKFSAGDVDGFLRLWHRSMVKLAVLVFAVTAFFMVFANLIITFLFSSKYAEGVWLFRLYLLFLPLRITVLDQVLASLGDTRSAFKAQAVTLIGNVVLGAVAMRTIGWFGPAVSALAMGYVWGALILSTIASRTGVGISRLVPWSELGRVAMVATLAGAIAASVKVLPLAPVPTLALGFAVYAVVYLAGSLKTNAITMKDIDLLRGWVRLLSRA